MKLQSLRRCPHCGVDSDIGGGLTVLSVLVSKCNPIIEAPKYPYTSLSTRNVTLCSPT